jgi:hypothetical protein
VTAQIVETVVRKLKLVQKCGLTIPTCYPAGSSKRPAFWRQQRQKNRKMYFKSRLFVKEKGGTSHDPVRNALTQNRHHKHCLTGAPNLMDPEDISSLQGTEG